MADKIENCPFCGSNDIGAVGDNLYCITCMAETHADNWNRRASPWHPASEVPPEGWVIVRSEGGNVSSRYWACDCGWLGKSYPVSQWMEIPPCP